MTMVVMIQLQHGVKQRFRNSAGLLKAVYDPACADTYAHKHQQQAIK
jgi:hypothetical protein